MGLAICLLGLAVIYNLSQTYDNTMKILHLQEYSYKNRMEMIELMSLAHKKNKTEEDLQRIAEIVGEG